jgi:hypothetical protein
MGLLIPQCDLTVVLSSLVTQKLSAVQRLACQKGLGVYQLLSRDAVSADLCLAQILDCHKLLAPCPRQLALTTIPLRQWLVTTTQVLESKLALIPHN